MFPSAVTALTGAGRSRSPERAGRERARLRERESEGGRGARGEQAGGREFGGGAAERRVACVGERPLQESAGPRRGRSRGARARVPPGKGKPERGCGDETRWPHRESARRRRSEATESRRLCAARDPRRPDGKGLRGRGEHTLWRLRGRSQGRGRGYTPRPATRGE
jgi:hypothetical protein